MQRVGDLKGAGEDYKFWHEQFFITLRNHFPSLRLDGEPVIVVSPDYPISISLVVNVMDVLYKPIFINDLWS